MYSNNLLANHLPIDWLYALFRISWRQIQPGEGNIVEIIILRPSERFISPGNKLNHYLRHFLVTSLISASIASIWIAIRNTIPFVFTYRHVFNFSRAWLRVLAKCALNKYKFSCSFAFTLRSLCTYWLAIPTVCCTPMHERSSSLVSNLTTK